MAGPCQWDEIGAFGIETHEWGVWSSDRRSMPKGRAENRRNRQDEADSDLELGVSGSRDAIRKLNVTQHEHRNWLSSLLRIPFEAQVIDARAGTGTSPLKTKMKAQSR